MKKNIVITIKRVHKEKDKDINNEDFIKKEDYNKFDKDFYYNKEVIIKDLSYILNIILKSILYKKEQEEILVKLMNILELDENNSITLYNLDNDIIKQQNIMTLSNDIKKYFRFECIKRIRNPETVKRPFLSIIKNICKMKYNILSCDVRIDINNN